MNGDGCDATCQREFCGDAIVQGGLGEECEDGNRNPFDGCTNDCTVCGDGVVALPEECDDGNTSSSDACDAQCRLPRVVGAGTPESCTETAFAAALAERSVRFNCGPAPVTITLTSEKVITADTIIDGGGRITLTGGGAVRLFTVTAVLDVRNLSITDGHGDDGGAIYNSGDLSLTKCTFFGNSTYLGGAIFNNGDLSLTNCTFFGNSANLGGAIINTGITSLTNCTFSANSAARGGGAIANYGGLSVTNSTFSGNSAAQGGGIINIVTGITSLTNCTLSENGGAISSDYCPVIDESCLPYSVTLTNTIIAESAGPSCDGPGVIADGGHNLQFPGTSCGATIPSRDPLLDPAGLRDNGGLMQTIALLPGSPAIDAGDAEVCASPHVNGVDQRGYARPGPGSENCSIGAFESGYPAPPCTGDCDGNDMVAVNELVLGVNIVLDVKPLTACPVFANSEGRMDIAQLVTGVNNALHGCGS